MEHVQPHADAGFNSHKMTMNLGSDLQEGFDTSIKIKRITTRRPEKSQKRKIKNLVINLNLECKYCLAPRQKTSESALSLCSKIKLANFDSSVTNIDKITNNT